jgi:hypothetical protein
MLLAQIDPTPIAEGLAKNPLAWISAVLLVAVGYLFRRLGEVQKEHMETIRQEAKEQREILREIVPLTVKLTESLETLEKITDRVTSHE